MDVCDVSHIDLRAFAAIHPLHRDHAFGAHREQFLESKRNLRPSSVSATRLFARSNRRPPSSSSRLRTCRVSEGWASRSFAAALVKLEASATATK